MIGMYMYQEWLVVLVFGDGFIGKTKTLSRGFRGGIMIFF
jgi:hypothetical protein